MITYINIDPDGGSQDRRAVSLGIEQSHLEFVGAEDIGGGLTCLLNHETFNVSSLINNTNK